MSIPWKMSKSLIGSLVIVFLAGGFNLPAWAEGPAEDEMSASVIADVPKATVERTGPSRLTGILSSGDKKQVRAKVESLRRLALALKALRDKRAKEAAQAALPPEESQEVAEVPKLPPTPTPTPTPKPEVTEKKEEKVKKKAWWER